MELFDRAAQPDWPWFEDVLTYDNAKLAHALILSGRATGQKAVFERGLQALRWLARGANLRERPFPAHRQQRLLPARRRARELRPAAHRGARHGVRLPGGLPRHGRRLVVRAGPARLRLVPRLERSRAWNCIPPTPAAAAMPCTWTASTETRARNPPWPSCSRWPKCASCKTPSPCSTSPAPDAFS